MGAPEDNERQVINNVNKPIAHVLIINGIFPGQSDNMRVDAISKEQGGKIKHNSLHDAESCGRIRLQIWTRH
ncbi:MAG TPA: hypothetical protein VG722_08010 [Tepidisphaeraceae bacterium]|nr:hypothetical protein [Tepidisphaeraceae bacterium]